MSLLAKSGWNTQHPKLDLGWDSLGYIEDVKDLALTFWHLG
jgi:hypothetical protein